MTLNLPPGTPQVTMAPHCPQCGSTHTVCARSQSIRGGINGRRAQKQYRSCRACGHPFPVIHLKGRPDEPPPAPPEKRKKRRRGRRSDREVAISG